MVGERMMVDVGKTMAHLVKNEEQRTEEVSYQAVMHFLHKHYKLNSIPHLKRVPHLPFQALPQHLPTHAYVFQMHETLLVLHMLQTHVEARQPGSSLDQNQSLHLQPYRACEMQITENLNCCRIKCDDLSTDTGKV